jgi:hypothetical protein
MRYEEIRKLVAADGTMFGDEVPNSKYLRNFCWDCGDAIRTTAAALVRPQYCHKCKGFGAEEKARRVLSREDIFDLMETAICNDFYEDDAGKEVIMPYDGFDIRDGKSLNKYPFKGGYTI